MTARKQLAAAALVLASVVAVIAAGKFFLHDELAPLGIGVEAPDFKAATLDSVGRRTRTLADYRGKVVMINIWATWCGPCRVEMPSIEQLYQAYGRKGLAVVAVSVDEPGTEPQIRNFVKQYGLTFEVLHDPAGEEGGISRAYQTGGYPETIVIGRDGIIRRKMLGAHNWDSPESRTLIERLLAEKAE